MDVRSLATLRAVRAQGGVTAAATVLHLTPSAVSQQLAALGREAGVALTERVGRGIRLTPAGDALADAAEDVAVALERARAACGVFLGSPVGVVDVSAFPSGGQLLLPGLLTRIARHDGITLRCADDDVAQAGYPALTDRADIVIAHRPEHGAGWSGAGRGLRVVPLLREPLDVAVAVGHPLAGRGAVRAAELADQDWIAVREGFPIAPVLAAVTAASGGTPRIAHRINDFGVAAALVAAGHGICLLPRYATDRPAGIRLLPLADADVGRRVDALLRPDRAERLVVRTVLDELVALAGEVGRG